MYLLDTHTLLWFFDNDSRLSKKAKIILEKENSKLFVNMISFWEIAIKQSISKIELSQPLEKVIENTFLQNIEIIPLRVEQILTVSSLEFHHRDPFDRLIIANAICQNLNIISKDDAFDNYNVKRIW